VLVDGRFIFALFDQVGSMLTFGDDFSMPLPFGERPDALPVHEFLDYAGHGRDPDTGLISMGERDYDPRTHRFISPDRFFLENPEQCVRSPKECDLFSYAQGNPLFYTDPSGKVVDIAIDVGFVFVGVYQLATDPSWTNAAALGLDVVSAVVPFATGLGRAYKGIAAADKTQDASRALRAMHKADNAAHPHGQHGYTGSKPETHFPDNPDHLLPDLPRDHKGRIHPNEVTRIRPEAHAMKPGETFHDRHHAQHYHVEIKIDPTRGWQKNNVIKVEPPGYKPGDGTGFLPGELFPGK
jgi:RHS repeat-associated protein